MSLFGSAVCISDGVHAESSVENTASMNHLPDELVLRCLVLAAAGDCSSCRENLSECATCTRTRSRTLGIIFPSSVRVLTKMSAVSRRFRGLVAAIIDAKAMARIARDELDVQFTYPLQPRRKEESDSALPVWGACSTGQLVSPLGLCVLAGRRASAEFILGHLGGMQVTAEFQDELDRTLRLAAGLGGRGEHWISLLLAHGASLEACDTDGRTALLVGIRVELLARELIGTQHLDPRLTQVLLAAGANVNVSTLTARQSALQLAAERRDLRMAQLLLQAGADVTHADWEGRTALFDAAFRGDTEMTRLLLDHGADVNHQDHHGSTVLLKAAFRGDIDIVRLVLSYGARIDITELEGATALLRATRRSHLDVAQLLLEYGADVNQAESRGMTALLHAIGHGDVHVAEFLLRHGANPCMSGGDGRAPLIVAVSLGDYEVASLLLRFGAEVNGCDSSGCSALLKATSRGDLRVVRLLLSHGANMLQPDQRGRTASFEAFRGGHARVIELLHGFHDRTAL